MTQDSILSYHHYLVSISHIIKQLHYYALFQFVIGFISNKVIDKSPGGQAKQIYPKILKIYY